jgi:DNA-binding HxlR family transcriptional regulator
MWGMIYRPKPLRSRDPLTIAVEILGDRWTLLIVRDLMLRNRHSFGELLEGGEDISTNILTDRLRRLEWHGLVALRFGTGDGRRIEYYMTQRGMDLAPCLVEMILWADLYEETTAPSAEIATMRANRVGYLKELKKRWRETQSRLRADGATILISSHGKTRRRWRP